MPRSLTEAAVLAEHQPDGAGVSWPAGLPWRRGRGRSFALGTLEHLGLEMPMGSFCVFIAGGGGGASVGLQGKPALHHWWGGSERPVGVGGNDLQMDGTEK